MHILNVWERSRIQILAPHLPSQAEMRITWNIPGWVCQSYINADRRKDYQWIWMIISIRHDKDTSEWNSPHTLTGVSQVRPLLTLKLDVALWEMMSGHRTGCTKKKEGTFFHISAPNWSIKPEEVRECQSNRLCKPTQSWGLIWWVCRAFRGM